MRISTYDAPQVATNAAPATMLRSPDGPSGQQINADQLQRAGQALQSAGGAAGAIAQDMAKDANELRVNDAMNQYVRAQTEARVEAMTLKGRNALERPDGRSLPDEFGERLQKEAQAISESLSNPEQKRAFAIHSTRMSEQFRGALSEHMVQQQQVYRKETQKATIDTAVNQGSLLWGDEKLRAQSAATITRAVDAIALDLGMSKEARDAALMESMSPMHVGVMKGMIQAGQASAAKTYYDENSAVMPLQARASMQGVIKEASDTQAGEAGADSVWARLGPQDPNQPVKIFDMERELRESMKDNPDAMKRGVDALRQRAQAFNAQQAETNAAGVNGVFRMIDAGAPLATIQRSAEWLALPDLKKHEIRKMLDNEAYTATLRANANDARSIQQLQIAEHRTHIEQAGAAFEWSPERIAATPRSVLQALLPTLGRQYTQDILAKKDSIEKRGLENVKIDEDDQKVVMQEMGMKPYAKVQSEEGKALIVTARSRIERALTAMQAAGGQPFSREKVNALMREEVAKVVTVDREWFGSDNSAWFPKGYTVPIVELTPEQAGRVRVPQADRAQIAEALQAMAQRDPKNPAYAHTEDNVRRLYLMRQSPAAAYIPPKKP